MKRWTRRFVVVLLLGLAVVYVGLSWRHWLGWWRGEASYGGRYTNEWRAVARHWRPIPLSEPEKPLDGLVFWERRVPVWQQQFGSLIGFPPNRHGGVEIPYFDGAPEAVPVLLE